MRAGVRLAPISAAGKEEEWAGDGVPAPGKRLCRAPVPAGRREMGTRRPRQRLTLTTPLGHPVLGQGTEPLGSTPEL